MKEIGWHGVPNYSLNPEADRAYRIDGTFRKLVDTLRSLLKEYQFTPLELRQAAVLASTMHASERIEPLYMYVDEAKGIPMFGGATTSGRYPSGARTATGASATLEFLKERMDVAKALDGPPKGKCVTDQRKGGGDRRKNPTHGNKSEGARKESYDRQQPAYLGTARKENGDRRLVKEHVIAKRFNKVDHWCIYCHLSKTYIDAFGVRSCTPLPIPAK